MPSLPELSPALRFERLAPPKGPVRMVLDTDTFNEIDDQFAVAYALLSRPMLTVEALYAAPFLNPRVASAAEGMERSHEELHRILERMERDPEGFVYRGSRDFLGGPSEPRESAAAEDLIRRAMEGKPSDPPLYVAAIGAITNVASAILMEPAIIERIVVVWLGGQPYHWPSARDFNLGQDLHASRYLFDCGVPLAHIPCLGVASHLLTSGPEIARWAAGQGRIGDYLAGIFEEFTGGQAAWAKEIWDLSAVAFLINSRWTPSQVTHSPLLNDQCTWSRDESRHFIRVVSYVRRNPIFQDLFAKLAEFAETS